MSGTAEALQPFDTRTQKRRADAFGLFVFLASELMMFGALLAGLVGYRVAHPGAAAEMARHLNLALGAANTAILLTSSLMVALAAVCARRRKPRPTAWLLAAAAVLGLAFLAVKGIEYHAEFAEGLAPGFGPASPLAGRPAQLFMSLYFVGTGLHAIHVAVGVAMLAFAGLSVGRRRWALDDRALSVELIGLYWHLVDVVWVFLFPLLYLART